MPDTTQRVLRLLAILESRPVWSGPELAGRLGVTERTVRRDVERLRELGYPVEAERGAGGGYRLGAGRKLPPLLLDDDEATAVAFGLRRLGDGAIDQVAEPALRALAKLDQVLPAPLRARLDAIVAATVALPGSTPSVPLPALATLAAAIRGHQRTRFTYRSGDGQTSERTVEPYRLVASHALWYLLAFDLDRDDWRTFRVDRLADAVALTFTFRPREAPDPEELLRGHRPERWPVHAVARLRRPRADVERRIPATYGRVEREENGWSVLPIGGPNVRDLAWHLAWAALDLDCDLRVDGNPDVAAALSTLGERLATFGAG